MTISSKHIQSFWSLRSSLRHNVYLFSTWVKKDFHFFSEHFLFLTNFFSRELTCWAFLLARTFAMFSLHSTDSANIASFPDFSLPREMPSFPGKLVMCLVWTTFYKRREIFSAPEKKNRKSCTLSQVWQLAPTNWLPKIIFEYQSLQATLTSKFKKWKLLSCKNFQQLVGGRESNGTF